MSFTFAVAWMCLEITLKLLSCFGLYMKFHIPAFEFFHYIDISNGAFKMDFNLSL